jgi:predicted nucleic acid-binding protein
MTVNQQTLLFIDASALFLAARTPDGGTGYLLKICQAGFFRACASPVVLHEAERNLLSKASYDAVLTHREQVATTHFILVSVPPPDVLSQFTPLFFEDDHVVASALSARAEFLITVDRQLIRRIQASGQPFIAITPKDFIENYFPNHPDYNLIRRTVI